VEKQETLVVLVFYGFSDFTIIPKMIAADVTTVVAVDAETEHAA